MHDGMIVFPSLCYLLVLCDFSGPKYISTQLKVTRESLVRATQKRARPPPLAPDTGDAMMGPGLLQADRHLGVSQHASTMHTNPFGQSAVVVQSSKSPHGASSAQ